jgi:hypothetical protein
MRFQSPERSVAGISEAFSGFFVIEHPVPIIPVIEAPQIQYLSAKAIHEL